MNIIRSATSCGSGVDSLRYAAVLCQNLLFAIRILWYFIRSRHCVVDFVPRNRLSGLKFSDDARGLPRLNIAQQREPVFIFASQVGAPLLIIERLCLLQLFD